MLVSNFSSFSIIPLSNTHSGGGIYHQDFTAVVQHTSVVQNNIPAARASVQKNIMSKGTDKMAELRARLDDKTK